MPIYKMEGKKDGLQKYRVRINYIDRDGKKKQIDRVAYGKENAKDLERQLNYELKSGEATTNRMTVQQLYDEYIEVKKAEIRETSLVKSKKRLEHYVLPMLKDYKLTNLSLPVMQKWKLFVESHETSAGNNLSIATKQGIYADFRALLNYAVKMEYIQKNPLVALGNFRNAYEEAQKIDFYTSDEFLKFIAVAKAEAETKENAENNVFEWNFYVFFAIAFYSGMRKGEINALKWSDIENNTIHIRRSINQKLKGGDRETPPKNKSSIRDLQMPLPLINILNQHRTRCERLSGFTADWRICGGTTCLRDSTIQNRNKHYAEIAELKTIRIHDYRHSHASLLANSGINIQEIARRLGHSKVEITWNIYSHLYPREEDRAIEILNKIV